MSQAMSSFFTRENAERGIKVPLALPNGEKTEHYLMIRGVDSVEFQRADQEMRRQVRETLLLPEKEQQLAQEKLVRELQASLVISWSFDEPCTIESVSNFFYEAPHIGSAVDRAASNRKLFMTGTAGD